MKKTEIYKACMRARLRNLAPREAETSLQLLPKPGELWTSDETELWLSRLEGCVGMNDKDEELWTIEETRKLCDCEDEHVARAISQGVTELAMVWPGEAELLDVAKMTHRVKDHFISHVEANREMFEEKGTINLFNAAWVYWNRHPEHAAALLAEFMTKEVRGFE